MARLREESGADVIGAAVDVNVLAAACLIRTYLPGMAERGWGRVVQIASDAAIVIPSPDVDCFAGSRTG